MKFDERILEYATENQKIKLLAWNECGSQEKAAKTLGLTRTAIKNAYTAVKAKARKAGLLLEVDDGYIESMSQLIKDNPQIGGISDMQENELGKPIWMKFKRSDLKAVEFMSQLSDSLVKNIKPLPVINEAYPSTDYITDIIPWFNIGDGHLGMISYEHEVGHNFDLKIAKRDLCYAMKTLIDREPTCERCVIQDMGDMTHYDNNDGITAASGHALDYDTRYSKMIDVYADVMRFMIEYAAKKFKYIDVIINQGNHSRVNDLAARKFFSMLFSKNERINILDNQNVFIPYRMGNTFVMCHHSDKCKPKQLAHVMATDFADDWGESKYRYIDIGHIHHNMQLKEHPGVTVESFNQLATHDKYAHDGGWRSRSCLTVVRRSRTYGEIGRQTVTLDEVRDIINKAPAGTESSKRRSVYTV